MRESRLKIPHFPQFEPFGLTCQSTISGFNNYLNSNYSDFVFTSLFTLDNNNSLKISNLNENLVVIFDDSVSGETLLSILGKNCMDQSLNALLEYAGTSLKINYLTFVPELAIKALESPERFRVKLNRDNCDYLYKIAHQADLLGADFANLRRKRNLCQRLYSPKFMKLSKTNFDDCWRLQEEWRRSKVNLEKESILSLQREADGLEKAFLFWDQLNLTMFGIAIDRQLKAFALLEEIPKKTLLIHHFKTARGIKGLGEFFFWSLAQEFRSKLEFINFEQDLGSAGLRKFKKYLHPCCLLRKYVVGT